MTSKFSIFANISHSAAAKAARQAHEEPATLPSSALTAEDTVNRFSVAPSALDSWIETKVDFDDDDDDEDYDVDDHDGVDGAAGAADDQLGGGLHHEDAGLEAAPNRLARDGGLDANGNVSVATARQELGAGNGNGNGSGKARSLAGTESVRSTRSARSRALDSSEGPFVEADGEPEAGDEGKYSLLHYALYNFREAIDKYALVGRAAASETSTLRGSLKLIETLRGGAKSATADREQPAKAAADWTWRELAQMVKFSGAVPRQPLLKLPGDELNKRALDCYLAIMQYMGDLAGSRQLLPGGEVECVYLILMNCYNYPILRDEIYCQLMKQTTNNRSGAPDSCLRGWRLFSIVAAYFDCSPAFRAYLLKYLETAAYDKRRAYCSVALLCLQNLRKTLKYGGRKNVPSIEEIAATSAGRNSKRQIYRLPGGTERVINTKSTTVVDDIILEICAQMLNVSSANEMLEFSLYCIADGDLYTMPLNRDEYILDITTELIKNQQQYFLIFCRSIWHYPLRLDSQLYIEVIYNQIAPDYLEGLLMVLPEGCCGGAAGAAGGLKARRRPLRLRRGLVEELARLAALLHRASGSEAPGNAAEEPPQKEALRYLLPKPVLAALKGRASGASQLATNDHHSASSGSRSSSSSAGGARRMSSTPPSNASNSHHNHNRDDDHDHDDSEEADLERERSGEPNERVLVTAPLLCALVQDNWRQMSAFEPLDAKAQFLDLLRHWPLFGSSFFAIKLIQRDLILPMEFILALNKLGIQMLDLTTHQTVHHYPFNEVISTRKVRSDDGALFLDLKCGNLMKRTIIRIQTDQAHEISRLIRQYIDIEQLQHKQRHADGPLASRQSALSSQASNVSLGSSHGRHD